ncbi:MAG: xylulokinase [Ruminococcus sp.]|nr:xylulokinase [Ruminococcus sp.]
MKTLLGIDIGTSSTKALLMDENGTTIALKKQFYRISIPQPGWAEQNPEDWWQALIGALTQITEEFPEEMANVAGVGLTGQMHGLVAVDIEGKPVRPAIIWMDQRATKQLEEIQEKISWKEQANVFHNRVFNGFALASLLWMKENEPENYERIYKVFQPKDYIRYCLTGRFGTEVSDASAALFMNVKKRTWATKQLNRLGISESILPTLGKSMDIAGTVSFGVSLCTGIPEGIPVIFGAGDQQAQSIGNGVVKEGLMISNIGTGAQVSAYCKKDIYDGHLRTHTFCHGIPDSYTIYGAMLCGGLSVRWLKNNILHGEKFQQMSEKAEKVEPGCGGLIFLPYLTGERTPHMNPKARGIYFGLSLEHTDAHLTRAMMEGVAFALKDSMRIMEEIGIPCEKMIASGGACNSPLWLQIQADIFGKEVQVCRAREQACLGACIMAGVAVGLYENIEKACEQLIAFDEVIYKPREKYREMYENLYYKYRKIYKYTNRYMGFEREKGLSQKIEID